MIPINKALVEEVSAIAQSSPRKRTNHNFHPELSDTLQRLLNAMEPGTYVQPHKHEDPDKDEAFIILQGKALVVEFDEKGNITNHIVLSPTNGNYGVEIRAKSYHSVIILEKGTVLYEVKHGPYQKLDDKCFARWAPKEGEAGTEEYINSILKKLGIN